MLYPITSWAVQEAMIMIENRQKIMKKPTKQRKI